MGFLEQVAEVVAKAETAKTVEPIKVSQEQHDALEALTAVCMVVAEASSELPDGLAELSMDKLDEIWRRLVVVV